MRLQIFMLVLPMILSAQPAVEPRRVLPPKNIPPLIPPLLQQYDFGAQVRTLEGTDLSAPPTQVKPELTAPTTSNTPVPKDYHPKTDVPLTATALEAVRVSEQWQEEKNAPSSGPDGRVMYSYGAGLPTVVCAPLRVCMIELQAGEKILGDPHIGDSVRWNISAALFGTRDQTTPIIILKPQSPGLDTNLLITTDRRAYYLRLISKPEDYVARAAFSYPEDDAKKWVQKLAAEEALAKRQKHEIEVPAAMIAVEKLNFDYTVRGDGDLRPVRVFDDGSKTFIQMPPDMQHREAPALLIIASDGKGELTNYRVKDQIYIVDRLFDRANLVLGSGKKAQKVGISRGHKQ